ncbi:LLM class flavin-dependent oxidoreductase, partial [Thioalkalivibrio sp.]|uniref:LLM class flavin-dependent oxidoreductase n=1 Tax=Thioalkalivibrio sp. TaxID=2093813 RepID=UPI00397504AC
MAAGCGWRDVKADSPGHGACAFWLGTWVTPLVARDVVHVARSAANVDQLSGGRLLLGFGLGNATE